MKRRGFKRFCLPFLCLAALSIPAYSIGQEINQEGWPVPDLRGLVPYSVTVKKTDAVEKLVEKFLTLNGGQVARISGNGKVFAYAVDSDLNPPIDYLILDPDGNGKFIQKFRSEESYVIPPWVSD